ncbi:hypothetical protein TWF694_011361 [Orbilia ellipsospora]|uniref:Phosphoglycerate mutase-like protein n=1 Tax=Orbilia ellipsospora TaxID=2528407 RepID=A0AAV9X7L8_9PEZI
MPPRAIYLVRHAEGFHNVNWQHHLRDPDLTPLGHKQCATLAGNFPYHANLTTVICSPLKRTIQTTLESFHPAISRLSSSNPSFKIITNPYFQETGEWECDIGSEIPELNTWLENYHTENPQVNGYEHISLLDFSLLERESPFWPAKKQIFAANKASERSQYARQWLYENFSEYEEVVIVSHGGFLHFLTDDWGQYDESLGTAWKNTDWKCFKLVPEGGRMRLVPGEGGSGNIEGKDDGATEKAEVYAGGHIGEATNKV